MPADLLRKVVRVLWPPPPYEDSSVKRLSNLTLNGHFYLFSANVSDVCDIIAVSFVLLTLLNAMYSSNNINNTN